MNVLWATSTIFEFVIKNKCGCIPPWTSCHFFLFFMIMVRKTKMSANIYNNRLAYVWYCCHMYSKNTPTCFNDSGRTSSRSKKFSQDLSFPCLSSLIFFSNYFRPTGELPNHEIFSVILNSVSAEWAVSANIICSFSLKQGKSLTDTKQCFCLTMVTLETQTELKLHRW